MEEVKCANEGPKPRGVRERTRVPEQWGVDETSRFQQRTSIRAVPDLVGRTRREPAYDKEGGVEMDARVADPSAPGRVARQQ